MLKNIQIKGFKSIKDLAINLHPINLLIGANGVGKTNFISFFKLLNNVYEQRLQQYALKRGVDNLLYYGRKQTTEISGYLDFGGNTYQFILEPNDYGGFFIAKEHSIYHHEYNNKSFENVNIHVQESLIKESNIHQSRYLRKHLESYKIYHFHDTSVSAPLRTPSLIDDNRVLKEDGGNLGAYLYLLQKKYPKSFKRIEKTVKSIAPFFERFNLAPDRLDESRIKLVWNEVENPEMYFDAGHLSDGSIRFIALATLLLQPNLPNVIIIDEPELGLHPVAINKLAGLIKVAAQKGCQLIISTQSVNLLNNFSPKDIITVDKEENQSIFRRLDEAKLKEWLNDYSIGELWTKSVLKGQPQ